MFRIPDLIIVKRNGGELNKQQIQYFIDCVVNGRIEECQIGAMLMAIFMKGMTKNEMSALTWSMMNSGEVLTWPNEWQHLVVDKHSTGGVGDKVSLPLAPALAACGMKVPMISGRSLGHTGGTLDKLESIPGFSTAFSTSEIKEALEDIGCCIVGQTKDVCPADKVLYARRDVTGTVASTPLITSSIISKKAAESPAALILDCKFGKGAFMKKEEEATKLAITMVETSKSLGIKTAAFITDMNWPIGNNVGHSLEVIESIQCLQGQGPVDLEDLVVNLGGELLHLAGKVSSAEDGCTAIAKSLKDGSALKKFEEMCIQQGVTRETARKMCDKDANFAKIFREAKFTTGLKSPQSGYIHGVDAMAVAQACLILGAGRTKPDEEINKAVGVKLQASVGNYVKAGDTWIVIHHDEEPLNEQIREILEEALLLRTESPSIMQVNRVKKVIT